MNFEVAGERVFWYDVSGSPPLRWPDPLGNPAISFFCHEFHRFSRIPTDKIYGSANVDCGLCYLFNDVTFVFAAGRYDDAF